MDQIQNSSDSAASSSNQSFNSVNGLAYALEPLANEDEQTRAKYLADFFERNLNAAPPATNHRNSQPMIQSTAQNKERKKALHVPISVLQIGNYRLKERPSFFHEMDPKPRKHTNWVSSWDFTGNQASTHRLHVLEFSSDFLEEFYTKLIESDSRLNELSKRPCPAHSSPYFTSNGSDVRASSTRAPSPHQLGNHIKCPTSVQVSPLHGAINSQRLEDPADHLLTTLPNRFPCNGHGAHGSHPYFPSSPYVAFPSNVNINAHGSQSHFPSDVHDACGYQSQSHPHFSSNDNDAHGSQSQSHPHFLSNDHDAHGSQSHPYFPSNDNDAYGCQSHPHFSSIDHDAHGSQSHPHFLSNDHDAYGSTSHLHDAHGSQSHPYFPSNGNDAYGSQSHPHFSSNDHDAYGSLSHLHDAHGSQSHPYFPSNGNDAHESQSNPHFSSDGNDTHEFQCHPHFSFDGHVAHGSQSHTHTHFPFDGQDAHGSLLPPHFSSNGHDAHGSQSHLHFPSNGNEAPRSLTHSHFPSNGNDAHESPSHPHYGSPHPRFGSNGYDANGSFTCNPACLQTIHQYRYQMQPMTPVQGIDNTISPLHEEFFFNSQRLKDPNLTVSRDSATSSVNSLSMAALEAIRNKNVI
ncbi:hypothetical protein L6164_006575 [Bauhinia variegata]|uniref:Uncharacterized protein n=1 Tax=Bauhinia variegata TaxID=167791 RepID=A0ACB9PUX4_BAUVA|nr:hypothetical protein L6164_006575 [Bauhinia variegata]